MRARHSKQHSKMSCYNILVPCQCPPADTGYGKYQLSTCLDLAVSWLLMQQLQTHQETTSVRGVYVQRFGNMRGKHLQWDGQAVVLCPQPQVRGERLIKKRSRGQRVHPKTGHLKITELFSWGDEFMLSLQKVSLLDEHKLLSSSGVDTMQCPVLIIGLNQQIFFTQCPNKWPATSCIILSFNWMSFRWLYDFSRWCHLLGLGCDDEHRK